MSRSMERTHRHTAGKPALPSSPPLTLPPEEMLRYYHSLGELEAFYFQISELENPRADKTQWRQLNQKLAAIESRVTRFCSETRARNALCADALTNNLSISRRLLWLDVESSEAGNIYLLEEGAEINTYKENNWFKEPYFWEDNVGLLSNRLCMRLIEEDDSLTLESILDSMDYSSDQERQSLDQWSQALNTLLPSIYVNKLEQLSLDAITETKELIYQIPKRSASVLQNLALAKFARARNSRCLEIAQVLEHMALRDVTPS